MGLGNRIAFTGDSITIGNCDQVNNVQASSWGTYLTLSSGGQLQHVGNFGHGGYTSTQLLALFDSEPLAASPNIVGILCGTNDTLDGSNLPTTTAVNIKAMVAKARAAGARPFLCTLPPQGTAALPDPAAPVLRQAATGGTLAAGTYSYKVVAKNNAGVTLASPAATVTVAAGTTNTVTIEAPFVVGAVGYDFYGRVAGSELKIGSTAATGAEVLPSRAFTDTGSATPSGAQPGANTTAVAVVATSRLKITTINTWLRRYASVNRIPLVDFYGALVDPATGMYQTGLTIDGTHPVPMGQRIMGALAWATISNMVPRVMPPLAQENADPTNLKSNGCLLTGSANLPTSWASYGGSTTGYTDTLAAKTGFKGKALTAARSIADVRYHDSDTITTGFSVGDRILVSFVMQTEGAEAGGMGSSYTVRANGANISPASLKVDGGDVGPAVWAQEFVVPAGTTSLYFKGPYLSFGIGQASVGQLTFTNLTTGQLLTP